MSGSTIMGVHIAAGVIWVAQASTLDGTFVDDRVDRLQLESGDLEPGRALAELVESLEGLLGRLQPVEIAMLSAGSGVNRPQQADLLRRGRIEAAIMIAASHESTPLAEVTHDAVKKAVGARPGDRKALVEVLAEHVPNPPKKRWNDRAVAYAAALATQETSTR